MKTKNKIMIIGGHGKVGQSITKALKNYELILVGRKKENISMFLDKENIKAEIIEMDINNIDFSKIQDVCFVIVCVDQISTSLVEFCDRHEIDYMDVTANSEYIEKIQNLQLQGKSKILLGIGLAPGLTNLMAEKFISMYPSVKNIDIHLILGLGEKHGLAAIKWTLDNFLKDYKHKLLGRIKPFQFKNTLKTSKNRLKSYNFNFVDQHMLNKKYVDKNFTTYLGFDNSVVTNLIYIVKKIGLMRFLKYKKTYNIVESFLSKPKFGSDIFIVSIQSQNLVISASGNDEGKFTGLIAAEAAKRLISMDFKKGLLDISNIISIEEISENKLFGLKFTASKI